MGEVVRNLNATEIRERFDRIKRDRADNRPGAETIAALRSMFDKQPVPQNGRMMWDPEKGEFVGGDK